MKKCIFTTALALWINTFFPYGLPAVNLGGTNILDGGPHRLESGLYWNQTLGTYRSQAFLNAQGDLLGGVRSPVFTLVATGTDFFYQSDVRPLKKTRLGVRASQPIVCHSHLTENALNIRTSGAGLADLVLGACLQWDAHWSRDRVLFVHRCEFVASFPTGKNEQPQYAINPGNHFCFIDPYWAGSVYLTNRFAFSWRLHYLWCAPNKKLHFKAGQAVHLNFDAEFALTPRCWLGFDGYFLQQLTDNQHNGAVMPHTKERVLGVGPGIFYTYSDSLVFFAYLYSEQGVRNRAQGTRILFRLLYHF